MKQKIVTYLLGAQAVTLVTGYILKAPDLSATAERQSTIREQQTETAFERQEAMSRAQTCLVMASELPITDGVSGYFSSAKNGRIIIDKKRPFPDGTTVCDAFGNTGIVETDINGTPIITDIKKMPQEVITEILTERGLTPKPSKRPFAKRQK